MPTKGNGLAVVVDAEGLSEAAMRAFAAWTNLAETTFLLPPTEPSADYKVKIFTPVREMLFAGHPTLGSCAAWLHSGGAAKQPGVVRQECGIGIVDIITDREVPAFVAPPTTVESLSDAARQIIMQALGITDAAVVRSARLTNGPSWQVLELVDAQTVLAVDTARVSAPLPEAVGLIGPHPKGAECHYEVRMFAPSSGIVEDPITGSLNAAIAQWMRAEGRLDDQLLVAQGTAIDRHGRVYITADRDDDSRVLIGGTTNILIEGTVTL
jgi:PhzF family phenazine biosynthesis protein